MNRSSFFTTLFFTKFRAKQFLLACVLAVVPALAVFGTARSAVAQTWQVSSGTWGTAGSWNGGVPATTGTAYFTGLSDATVSVLLGSDTTSGGLFFNNSGSTLIRSNTTTARTLTIGGGGVTLAATSGPVTISATATGLAASNVILGAAQEWTNNSSSLLTNLGTITNGGFNLTLKGSGSTTLSGIVSGTGGVRYSGSSVLTLGGANAFTGGFTLDSGTVFLAAQAALGSNTPVVTINGGAIDAAASLAANNYRQAWNGDFAFVGSNAYNIGTGTVTLGGNRIVTVNANALQVNGPIVDGGSGYSLSKAGAGRLQLGGANTFSGGVTLSAGTLSLNSASALGTGTFTISGNGVALDGGGVTISTANAQRWNSDFSFAGSNTLNLGTGTVTLGDNRTVTVNASTLTIGGAIDGGINAYGLTKAGPGALAVSATNNAYAGAVTINGGTFSLSPGANNLSWPNASFTVNASAVLNVAPNANFGATIGSLAGSGTVNQPNAPTTLTFGGNNTSTTFSGVFRRSGASGGNLTKVGTGTMTLGGTGQLSDYGPTFNVSGGVVRLTNGDALGNATVSMASGVSVQFASSVTSGSFAFGDLTLNAGSALNLENTNGDPITLQINTGATTVTLSGTLSGKGNLVKSGPSLLITTANTTMSGTITVLSGTIRPVGAANATVNLEGGSLQMVDNQPWTIAALQGTSSSTIIMGSNQSYTFGGNNASTTFAGMITGSNTTLTWTKSGTGTMTLTGTIQTTGSAATGQVWTIAGGVVLPMTTAATGSIQWLPQAGGALGVGYALDQTVVSRISTGTASAGAVALGANSSNPINFATGTHSALSLGAVSGTWTYDGTLTPQASTYRLGGGGGTLDFRSMLVDAGGTSRSLVVGGNAAGLGGTVLLSPTNSFTGKTTIQNGTIVVETIGDVAGGNTTLGNPSSGNGTIAIGSAGATGRLLYTGTGHSSNRAIDLAGTTGGAVIEANGSGPLVLAGTVSPSVSGAKVFTLGGSNTGTNSIGVINGTDVSVTKTGPGTWRLTGNSGYTGRLTVLDGTVLVSSSVAVIGSDGAFGKQTSGTLNPLIGDSSVTASGTVALLAEGVSVARGVYVPTGSGSQTVVIGGIGTGTTTYLNSSAMRLGRGVTLQASTGGTVVFENEWQDFSGNGNAAVALTIGSAGNAGTVVFSTVGGGLPASLTAVNVVAGTARLNGGTDTISNTTPVTVGATLGAATLDLNGLSQTLSNLSFVGNSGSITSGTLVLASSGTASLSPVGVSGTAHVISSLVSLRDNATFAVNSPGQLLISSTISETGGARSLTKTGLGTLRLSAANTYSGATNVNAGTLALGISNALSNSTAVSVAGGVLDLGSSSDTVASLTLTSGSVTGSGTLTATTYSLGGGAVSANLGGGTLNVTGNASLTGNSAADAINLNAGALTLGGGSRFTGSPAVTGSSGASLTLGGNESFGSLAGFANIGLGGNRLTTGSANSNTSYSGVLSGAGGLTKLGSGVFTLAGNNTYSGSTSIAAGRLAVDGSLASAVSVQAGATLGGSGRLAGNLTGDGLIAPGNSPGILTVDGQIAPTSTTSFAFEFTGTGSPTWSNASASVNDVLRLTNSDPFTSGLGSGNIVNIYFDVASLANGDTFLGGFFSDRTSGQLDFMAELGSPAYQFFVLGNGSGTATSYNGKSYYTLAQYNPSLTGATVSVTTVASADFAGNAVTNGQVTQFVIVPEPGAIALAGIGIAAAAWAARRRP